jgi:hypothetical protein
VFGTYDVRPVVKAVTAMVVMAKVLVWVTVMMTPAPSVLVRIGVVVAITVGAAELIATMPVQ